MYNPGPWNTLNQDSTILGLETYNLDYKILTFTKNYTNFTFFNIDSVYSELFTSPKGVKNWMTLQDLDSPVRTMAPVTARTLPLWFQQQQTAEIPVSNTTGSITSQTHFLYKI